MTRVGLRSAETLAVTGLVTVAMKSSIGRSRPGYARQPDEFNSFSSVNGFWSFPSGHTSTAFALATVLTLELGEEAPWVPYVAFPLATWVGTSRVIDERHWPTDVIAGAALGILVAQIWHGIRGPSSGSWSGLEPGVWSDPDGGTLLGLSWAFGNGGRPNREL